jgi:lactate dehydrogenase-like 2-hydroxyacid dehydrogenase
VTEEIIAAAPNLKLIGRAGTGVDNIDVVAATNRGILVMNTPGANTVSAAEHTVALLLAVARNIQQAAISFKVHILLFFYFHIIFTFIIIFHSHFVHFFSNIKKFLPSSLFLIPLHTSSFPFQNPQQQQHHT